MVIQSVFYAFTFWMGVYLIARDLTSPRLRWAGLGVVAYALAIALDLMASLAAGSGAVQLLQLHWAFMLLPALFWCGAVLEMLPEANPVQQRLVRLWAWVVLPLVLLAALLFALGVFLWSGGSPTAAGYAVFGLTSLLPLIALIFLIAGLKNIDSSRRATGLVLVATLFFTLGAGAIMLSSSWIAHEIVLLGVGFDIILLGLAVVLFDAFEQGEALGGDMLRSLAISSLIVLIFAGQVVFVITISTGPTLSMVGLLLATITAGLLLQGFAAEIQAFLDWLVFKRMPRLQQERRELSGVANALPKAKPHSRLDKMDEKTFYKATRRALSHFNTLPKLAVNPLNEHPQISRRIAEGGAPDNTLERTYELKKLLSESIDRLKPDQDRAFGTSDAWRYYNSLYFPYVAGLRVYSRTYVQDDLDQTSRQALDWFQVYVPERTLHNWQNAAAKMVAQDLWEQMAA